MRTRLLFVLVLLAVAIPAGARADDTTLIDTTLVGNQWFAAHVTVTDSTAEYWTEMTVGPDHARTIGGTLQVIGPNSGGGTEFAFFPPNRVTCDASLGSMPVCEQSDSEGNASPDLLVASDSFGETGDFYVVAENTSTSANGSAHLTFKAASGVTVVSQATGEAFMYDDQAFGGRVNANIGTGLGGVQTILGGEIDKTIAHNFFGWFGSSALFNGATCTDPDGRSSYCSAPGAEGPAGKYTFKINQASPTAGTPRAWLFGADVALP